MVSCLVVGESVCDDFNRCNKREMMVTITWHLLTLIILEIAGLIWVITRDGSSRWLGSDRDWAGIAYFIMSVIAISIYGGVFWW